MPPPADDHESELRDALVASAQIAVSALVPGGGALSAAIGWAATRREAAFRRGMEERLHSLEEHIEALLEDDARLMIVVDGFDRARRSLHEDHAAAMGRVVAATLTNGPDAASLLSVDRAAVLLRLLDDLQPLHVAVLSALGQPYAAKHPGLPRGTTQTGDLDADGIRRVIGGTVTPEDVVWALQDLTRLQLVRYTDRSPDGISYLPGPLLANLLPTGRELLNYLDRELPPA